MIDGRTLSPWSQIYTFVAADGTNIHIHSPLLRQHCLAIGYPTVLAPIHRQLAKSFITDNIVSPRRVLDLRPQDLFEPIILCKTEAFGRNHPTIPDVLLVDGHHRYTRTAMDGLSVIRAWLLDLHQWQPFTVTHLPDRTHDQLKSEPILTKPHWGPSVPNKDTTP